MRDRDRVKFVSLEVCLHRPSACLGHLLVFRLDKGGVPSSAIWIDRIVRDLDRVKFVNLKVRHYRPSACLGDLPVFHFDEEMVVGVVV